MSDESRSSATTLNVSVFCGGSYVSGMEMMALSAVKGLKERGHRVRAVVSAWNDGDFPSRLSEIGIPAREVHFGTISLSASPKHLRWSLDALAHLPKTWYEYWCHLEAFQPDIVIIYDVQYLLWMRWLLADRPLIFHMHNFPDRESWWYTVLRWADGIVDRYAPASEDLADRLREAGIDSGKIEVVHNGIALPQKDPAAVSTSFDPPVDIGIVGQIGAWKGHDDLLDALRLLSRKEVPFRCHVFGRGKEEYVAVLKEKARSYNLAKRIIWHGFVLGIESIYQTIDLLVVPSRIREAFGLVAAEAGIRGIPVVASGIGGLTEIVEDGTTGYLVEPSSPHQLADRIQKLIQDPMLAQRMGANARHRVQSRFTADKMRAKLESVCVDLYRAAKSDMREAT